MNAFSPWLLRLSWLTAVVLLGYGAWPQFQNGIAVDEALPVPSYMIAGITLPKPTYWRAAAALKNANAANGDAAIAGAEAAMNAGAAGSDQAPVLESALVSAPASTRGWLLLARARTPTNPAKAAVALSQALILAPYDYWVAGPRARSAALLWQDLGAEARTDALAQVRMLWEEPQLRPQIPILESAPGGRALVARAFAGRRDTLVELNRWVSARRRQTQTAP